MVNLDELKNLIHLTSVNFQFEAKIDYSPIVLAIHEKIKNHDINIIQSKFENLWKMTNKEWNDEYGFRGRPSIGRWLEILIEKPLTDDEILRKKREYEENLHFKASIIGVWCNDPNLLISFPYRYKNPLNDEIKLIINKYCKVKEDLPDERIKKMAQYLKEKLAENKELFYNNLKEIARNQQPLLT